MWQNATSMENGMTTVQQETISEQVLDEETVSEDTLSEEKTSSRLNCRISPTIKRQAENAAKLLGQNMTAFTETALAEKAQKVLAEHERLAFSERDFERFVEIITNPQPPTLALQKAMARYEELRIANPDNNL
jgi:uncharacterized protein (DUF1778 family)